MAGMPDEQHSYYFKVMVGNIFMTEISGVSFTSHLLLLIFALWNLLPQLLQTSRPLLVCLCAYKRAGNLLMNGTTPIMGHLRDFFLLLSNQMQS